MQFDLIPKVGVGLLKLGMPQAELPQLHEIYGAPMANTAAPFIPEFSPTELEDLRRDLGEEGLQVILDALETERNFKQTTKTVFLPKYTVSLDFTQAVLVTIQISRMMTDLNYLGHRFFHTSPKDFLAALEVANGAPPLVKGPDCVFLNLNIYVWAAFEPLPGGAVRFLSETDELAQDKSVMVCSSPRNNVEDFSGHHAVSFR
jgi:hypothetical protein